MGYTSRRGRRPNEYASKSAHGHVINDAAVQDFLAHCSLPKRAEEVNFSEHLSAPFDPVANNPIHHVIAVDGGYNEVAVQKEFPSATICFFQFGALVFSVADLEQLDDQPFIDPDDIAKLKRIQRLKLMLPVRNVALKSEGTLTKSVRKAVYEFFCRAMDDDGKLIESLRWFLFEEYAGGVPSWTLASCPECETRSLPLHHSAMTKDHTFACAECGGHIYLTDVFRLHEVVDDELGAGEILGYLTTTIEQMILVHLIRTILRTKPALMHQFLFIKDGPLAFFGQTANMHQPMRALVRFLFERHNLYMAGLEKSGAFVEHADEIANILADGSILILDDHYIYRYILPGGAPANPYGSSTYYSSKLIFKTTSGAMYVVTVPTTESNPHPTETDLRNLRVILANIEKLRCDMYDNSLIPVALVNKLVSLANHPSTRILQKFAVDTMGR